MKKQTHYLLKSVFESEESYEKAFRQSSESGYRVVTFAEGPLAINDGLKLLIRNHLHGRLN